MAQNVTFMGASYADVPVVNLPKTGGGTASFTDVSGTTATAGDVAQGKIFYAADGSETAGTASGGGAQMVSGTFTGDGKINAALNIGFEPDIVEIVSSKDYAASGWAGVGDIVIIKNNISFIGRHNSTSATAVTVNANPNMDGAYGSSSTAPNYTPYGTYSSGTLTVSNKNDGVGTRFRSGVTYSWHAFKIT